MKNKSKKAKASFWSDGISDREFIMMISVATFFFFAALGMSMSLWMNISETYMEILQMTVPPLMTIIVSVFSIEGVEKFADRKTKQEIGHLVDQKMDNSQDQSEVAESVLDDIQNTEDEIEDIV